MAWPTPQDYNEAIQNPKLAFNDPELCQARPELTRLGIPRAITGNFASVYKMQNHSTLAVRCFLREFSDQQERYAHISEHLAKVSVPYTVRFDFLPKGIQVNARWYPVLKMEWVQGVSLDSYVKSHLGRPSALLALAAHWVEMARVLHEASIAHGDLQHGNVLVVGDRLKLIDYDGMFVPGLSGRTSHELGNCHYQHPARTEFDFGPYLDNFSEWVIYVALIALGAAPTLWQEFCCGDECLLFRKSDYEFPGQSKLLRALENTSDENVRALIAVFKSVLYLAPQEIPVLWADAPKAIPVTAPQTPTWITDHVKPSPVDLQEPTPSTPVYTSPAVPWVLDFIAPWKQSAPIVSLALSVVPERAFACVSSFVGLGIAGASLLGALSYGGGAVLIAIFCTLNVVLWRYRFSHEPVVAELTNAHAAYRDAAKRLSQVESELRRAEREKALLEGELDKAQRALFKKQASTAGDEQREKDRVDATLRSTLTAIEQKRRELVEEEATNLRKTAALIGARTAELDRRLAGLSAAEAEETGKALESLRSKFLADFLPRFSLTNATISGIGATYKARLRLAGVITAADINYSVMRVSGIGPSRAAALMLWRQAMEKEGIKRSPRHLPNDVQESIQVKYRTQRQSLENERSQEELNLRTQETTIRERYAGLREQLDRQNAEKTQKANSDTSRIAGLYAVRQKEYLDDFDRTKKALEDQTKLVDASVSAIRRQLFSLNWETEKRRRDLSLFSGVNFKSYLRRVFVPKFLSG